jgi:RimJ/RimL family protein N-acetyltransferase
MDSWAPSVRVVGRGLSVRRGRAADRAACRAVEIRRDKDAVAAYEIGYWIGAPYRGRGFATEAAQLALAWAARHLPPGRVGAYVDAENVASRRVLANCGMRLVRGSANHARQDYFSAP